VIGSMVNRGDIVVVAEADDAAVQQAAVELARRLWIQVKKVLCRLFECST
jgi:hypothetical protein